MDISAEEVLNVVRMWVFYMIRSGVDRYLVSRAAKAYAYLYDGHTQYAHTRASYQVSEASRTFCGKSHMSAFYAAHVTNFCYFMSQDMLLRNSEWESLREPAETLRKKMLNKMHALVTFDEGQHKLVSLFNLISSELDPIPVVLPNPGLDGRAGGYPSE